MPTLSCKNVITNLPGDTHKFASIMNKSVELPRTDAPSLFQVNLHRRNIRSVCLTHYLLHITKWAT